MRVRAEITCLNCGRFLAELEGDRDHSYKNAEIRYVSGARAVLQTARGLRCGYCGGKAIAEYFETVRQAA